MAESNKTPAMIVVMGASGCGKSSIGLALAQHLKVPFVDGDDLHPPENILKMSTGEPLNDMDRLPWLKKIRRVGTLLTSPQAYSLLSRPPATSVSEQTEGKVRKSTPPSPPEPVTASKLMRNTESKELASETYSVHEDPSVAKSNDASGSSANQQSSGLSNENENELEEAIAKIHKGSLPIEENSNKQEQTLDVKTISRRRRAVVIGCSALKLSYRNLLRGEVGEGHKQQADREELETYFLYLDGSRTLLLNRMNSRPGHFMKSNMLDSQLATLEPPSPESEENIGRVKLGKGQDDEEERGLAAVVGNAEEWGRRWAQADLNSQASD